MERRRQSRCRQDLRTDGPAAVSLAARPSEARAPAGALFRGPGTRARSPLLRSPAGFEGFALGLEHPRPNQPTVVELEELGERGRLHLHPAFGPLPADAQYGEHAMLVHRDALLEVQPEPAEGIEPGPKELPNPLRAAIRSRIWKRVESPPLEVGVCRIEASVEVPAVDRLHRVADPLHVLLRHRPPSISPMPGA